MWTLLSEISVSTQWDWSAPTTREWFRFEFVQLQEVKVDIVRGDGVSLFDLPVRVTTNSPQVLYFKRPPLGLGNHKIAIRTGDRVYRNYQLGWKVKIYVADDDVIPDSLDYSAQFQAVQTQQAHILTLLDELMPLARSNQAITSSVANTETVEVSTVSATILPANVNRKGVTLYSLSSSPVFFKVGPGASSDDRSFELLAVGDYIEVPFGYNGLISAVGIAAGSVIVTEFF